MSINYKAPKPTYTIGQRASYVIKRLFILPLIWDALKYIVNRIIGRFVGDEVLPASDNKILIQRAQNINTSLSQEEATKLHIEEISIETHDGAVLNGIEIKNRQIARNPTSDQNYIINFVGNNTCYEDKIEEMKKDALDLNCNVVGFNLRGVVKSQKKATNSKQLVIDGIAQVQRLLDEYVNSNNITLKGHSLGAGIATLVAKHFHQQGQPINLFNDRSFSSITNFVVGHIRVAGTNTGHKETFTRKVIAGVLKPFIWIGVNLSGWEIDAGEAFLAIPRQYREHMVVRASKNIRNDYIADDLVIPHYASIHAYIKGERRVEKDSLDKSIAILNASRQGWDLTVQKNNLSSKRRALKGNKMRYFKLCQDAHAESASKLSNLLDNSGETFFRNFVQSAHKDHGVRLSTMH